MANRQPTRRVTLLRSLSLPFAEGVLEYGEHAEGWQFVGMGTMPRILAERLGEIEVDGLIGAFDDKALAHRAAECCGVVVNVRADHPETGLPAVGNDDPLTGRLGAEHLLECGSANYGFVDDADELGSQRIRDAFVGVIGQAGRTSHVLSRSWQGPTPPQEIIGRWLAELPRPIGIMAHNDFFARLTINAATQLELRVPDEVAVLGVNNNPWMIAMAGVPLSSIQLDLRGIGYRAAKLLDGLMAGEVPPPPQLIPPIRVVARRSTDVTLTEDPLVSRAMQYIRDHAMDGINVEDVLREIRLSRPTLVKRMKQATGRTPHQAIVQARIDHAKTLLLNTEATVEQIADRCGFDRPPRLHEAFKRIMGMTPGQFRQQRSRSRWPG